MALVPLSSSNSVGPPGSIPGDPYIRLRLLGQGSFGRVMLVRDSRLAAAAAAAGDPNMALFVLKEVDLQQFGAKGRKEALKEVSFLNQLSHPYIISYKEFYERVVPHGAAGGGGESVASSRAGPGGQLAPLGKEDAQAAAAGGKRMLYIVMEYADGGDLDARIKRQKKQHSAQLFPEAQILDWFVQLVLALKHIHDRRILHRDIKSENIFLHHVRDENGGKTTQVKVGDFGISKTLASTMAQALTRIGTPYYLSPEICMNKPYNQKSDIWSLGVVLYELCTLRHPFDANSMESLLRKIVKTAPSPLNARVYSPELRGLVEQLLSKDPRKRPGVRELCRMDFLQPHIERHLSRAQLREEFSHTTIHGYSPQPLPAPASRSEGYVQQLQPLQQQLPPPQIVRKKKQRPAVPPQPLPPAVPHGNHYAAAAAALPPPSSRPAPAPAPGIRAVKPKAAAPTHLPSPYAQQLSQHHQHQHQPPQAQRRESHAAASYSDDEDEDGGPAPVHRASSKQAVPRQKRRSTEQQQQQHHSRHSDRADAPSYSPPVSALDIDADELARFRAYEASLMLQRERERDLERERIKERELQKQLSGMRGPAGGAGSQGGGTPLRHPVQQAPPAAGMSEGVHRRRCPEQYGARDGIVGSGPLPLPLPRVHSNVQGGMLPPADRRSVAPHSGYEDDTDDRYSEEGGGGGGNEYTSTRVRASERARREEEELAAIRETYQAEKAARKARRLAESEATRHNILPVDERITPAVHTHHAAPHHRSGASVGGSQGSRASGRQHAPPPPPPYGATGSYEDDFEEKEEATYRAGGGRAAAVQDDEPYEADEYEADFDEAPLPVPVTQQQQHRRFPSLLRGFGDQAQVPQALSHQRRPAPNSSYAAPPPVLPTRGIPAKVQKKQHHLQQR